MSDPDLPPSNTEVSGSQSLVVAVLGFLLVLAALAIGAWALLAAAFGAVLYWLIYTAAALAVVGIASIVWAFVRLA